MIRKFYLLIICISILGLLSCGKNEPQQNSIKNFILIYTDELDYNDIGAYGGKFDTPNIDELAENGIRFSNAYTTSPMCTPSRYSVITGNYPGRCNSKKFIEENPISEPYVIAWNTHVEEKDQTIPKLLKENGYITGMSGKWHIGIEHGEGLPEFKGNEKYEDEKTKNKLKKYLTITTDKIEKEGGFDFAESGLWTNFDGLPLKEFHFHNFGWITKGGIDFIEKHGAADKPFFLYFAPTAVHGPDHVESLEYDPALTLSGYDPSIAIYSFPTDSMKMLMEKIEPSKRHRFTGITNIDYQVGRIVKTLKEKGLYESTMIIFMADHGIEPGKATVSDKGNKVPFIISIPNNKQNGTISKALVQNIDILPTIMDYAGINLSKKTDGFSLKGILEGAEKSVRKYIYLESGLCRAVTDGKYKYVAFRYPKSVLDKMKNGIIDYAPNQLNLLKQQHSSIAMEYFPSYFDPDQLYDLKKDPYELKNIADSNNEIVEKYSETLKSFVNNFNHPFNFEIDPFLKTEKYNKLKQKTINVGTDWVSWWRSDYYWDYPTSKK